MKKCSSTEPTDSKYQELVVRQLQAVVVNNKTTANVCCILNPTSFTKTHRLKRVQTRKLEKYVPTRVACVKSTKKKDRHREKGKVGEKRSDQVSRQKF